ncbi:MAG: hypothetical protein KDK70_05910 [Myxococcales bacterium]|nr:hypothetical protein [Myxococcales bacterium]
MNTRRTICWSFALLGACSGAEKPDGPAAAPPRTETPKPPPEAPKAAVDPCKQDAIYFSKGVHNPCQCGPDECIETRAPTDPPDPKYPPQWTSDWTMYRVFQGYQDDLPPWGSPPEGLEEGEDYETSQGWTAYDSTYVADAGAGTGAMMEHYEKRCLPIFPIDNHFTCSFVSLGNTAYFLTYEQDRPAGMPPCCLFSPYNHPPRTNFIEHLPYSPEDSGHLGGALQAYRYVAQPGDIWFAYAFWKDRYVDADRQFLLPQSFYFSGDPSTPPNAPFVSQNYANFTATAPDPTKTWDQVAKMCPADGPPPPCQLFDPPKRAEQARDAAPPELPPRTEDRK